MPELLGVKCTDNDASSQGLAFAAETASHQTSWAHGAKCQAVIDDRCHGPDALLLATPYLLLCSQSHWGRTHLR